MTEAGAFYPCDGVDDPMSTAKHVRQIKQELDCFHNTVPPGLGDTEWTYGVLKALTDAGQHFGYDVAATWRGAGRPIPCARWTEWLYDVVWYDHCAKSGQWSMPLVAECEWQGESYIKEDFEKLLVARAGLRVMVYDARCACDGSVAKFG